MLTVNAGASAAAGPFWEALAIACGFNLEGGSKNFDFHTRPSHSELHSFVRPLRSTFLEVLFEDDDAPAPRPPGPGGRRR